MQWQYRQKMPCDIVSADNINEKIVPNALDARIPQFFNLINFNFWIIAVAFRLALSVRKSCISL